MKFYLKEISNQRLYIYTVLLISIHNRYCGCSDNSSVTFHPRDLYQLEVVTWQPKKPEENTSYITFLTVVCPKDQYKITATDPKNNKIRKLTNITCGDAVTLSFIKFETIEDAKEAFLKFPELEQDSISGNKLTKANLDPFFRHLAANKLEIAQIKNPLSFNEGDYTTRVISGNTVHTLKFGVFNVTNTLYPFKLIFKLLYRTNLTEEEVEEDASDLIAGEIWLNDYEVYEEDDTTTFCRNVYPKEVENLLIEIGSYIQNKDTYNTPPSPSPNNDPPSPNSDPPTPSSDPVSPTGDDNGNKPDDQTNAETEKDDENTGGSMKNVLIVLGVGGAVVVIIGIFFFLKRRKEVEQKNRKAMKKKFPSVKTGIKK